MRVDDVAGNIYLALLFGLDFRAMLPPLFADAAAGIFRRAMDGAASDFERVVEQHRWATMPSAVSHGKD
jgi:hypothetical protein